MLKMAVGYHQGLYDRSKTLIVVEFKSVIFKALEVPKILHQSRQKCMNFSEFEFLCAKQFGLLFVMNFGGKLIKLQRKSNV